MGLDIYFFHTSRPFEGNQMDSDDFREFREQVDKDAQDNLRKKLDKLLVPLRDAWNAAWEDGTPSKWWLSRYNQRYFTFVEQLRKLLCKNHEWKIYAYTDKILDFPELEAKLAEEVEDFYEPYDAYFRKVNFLFEYYSSRDRLVDSCYAFVTKKDLEDIIDRCEQILQAKKTGDNLDEGETVIDLAHELLPTTDGFFFGSTDYDDYYFWDVKDCLRQMKKFLKLYNKPGTGYVIFSY